VLAVHLWGLACDADALDLFCERHNLRLIFDAAHAFGATYRTARRGDPALSPPAATAPPGNGSAAAGPAPMTTMVGTRGAAEVFSLHATKLLNGFEGGLVATRDAAVAERVRVMRNFGFRGQARRAPRVFLFVRARTSLCP
jgi:dTDP-4-amino-4,6-dideoxygalactose transaminase